jgi:hypothetical protein
MVFPTRTRFCPVGIIMPSKKFPKPLYLYNNDSGKLGNKFRLLSCCLPRRITVLVELRL